MILPKYDQPPKPTASEEKKAYAIVDHRDGGVCVKCRRTHPIHGINHDHRKNRSQGGRTVASNLGLLCGSGTTGCHGWKTQNPAEATEQGYSVPMGIEPADWPARRWFSANHGVLEQGWALYTDDGDVIRITDAHADRLMRGEA
ncbi:MAG: HNH endonuclease signature motif containing protein [Mycetocola sp.]